MKGNYLKAQEQLHELLKLHIDNRKELIEDYRLLGELNRATVNFNIALTYLHKALDLEELENDPDLRASIYNRIAAVYFEQKKYDLSREYAEKSNVIAQRTGNKEVMVNNYTIIGAVVRGKDYKKSLEYFHRALNIARKENMEEGLPYILNNIAVAYFEHDLYDSLEPYALEALRIAEANELKAYIPLAASLLTNAYAKKQEYEKAFRSLEKSISYRDSLYQEGLVRKISEIEFKYEAEKKETENQLLKQTNEKNLAQLELRRAYIYGILIILFMALCVVYLLTRANRRRAKMLRTLEQKNKEIEKQRRELESLNEIKTRLFSIISHDLRRPFNSLKGVFTLMQQDLISETEWRMLSGKLGNQLNSASDLLDNLLLWAQSQVGGFEPRKSEVNIKDLAEDNIALLDPQAESKGVKLITNIPDETTVAADPDMIKLVIRNLISNAIKFSRRDDNVTVSADRKDGKVTVAVEDTGIGIEQESIEKLFSLRYSTIGTDAEKGTGIGLMLCKEFVEQNDGEIWVESVAGKGSTFYFSLPAAN